MKKEIENTDFLTFILKKSFLCLYFIFFLIFSPLTFSKEFNCHLNNTKIRPNLNKGPGFLFNSKKYQKRNFKINFKEVTVLMWSRNDLIHILLGSNKERVSIKTSFSLNRSQFFLTMNPSVKLKCIARKSVSKSDKAKQGNSLTIPSTGDNLIVEIKKDLLFKYYTEDGFELSRSLIFQNGKVYNKTRPPSKKDPWCLFRIEFKLNEDTLVPLGTKIPIKRAEVFKNNEDFTVFSYSFVDFATGKKGMETSRFVPFSIECTIDSKMAFSKKLLDEINQGAFKIYRKK